MDGLDGKSNAHPLDGVSVYFITSKEEFVMKKHVITRKPKSLKVEKEEVVAESPQSTLPVWCEDIQIHGETYVIDGIKIPAHWPHCPICTKKRQSIEG